MPLQRSYGSGLKSVQEFLVGTQVDETSTQTNQMAAMSLDAEPMDWEPSTPPPAAPPPSPPPAPLKRQRSADDNDLPDSKRRRLDFD
jgi:hypothetical protein